MYFVHLKTLKIAYKNTLKHYNFKSKYTVAIAIKTFFNTFKEHK